MARFSLRLVGGVTIIKRHRPARLVISSRVLPSGCVESPVGAGNRIDRSRPERDENALERARNIDSPFSPPALHRLHLTLASSSRPIAATVHATSALCEPARIHHPEMRPDRDSSLLCTWIIAGRGTALELVRVHVPLLK